MNGFLSIFKRELRSYFSTPLAYVFLVIFLLFASFMTFQRGFYEMRFASLRLFFMNMPLLFIFLAPAMAMRLWAEERRTNSIELLMTLPVTVGQAVLGKFLAAWTVIALALVLTCPMVITVCWLGRPDPGPIIGGYVGTMLLAGAYLAIGSFFSSLTRNQVIAFVLSVVACALFLYASSPPAMDYLRGFFPVKWVEVIESLSIQLRFESLMRGVLDLRDVAFFVILGAAWLCANVLTLKERMAAG
jgi:ABC-2 type transport system permease protein